MLNKGTLEYLSLCTLNAARVRLRARAETELEPGLMTSAVKYKKSDILNDF